MNKQKREQLSKRLDKLEEKMRILKTSIQSASIAVEEDKPNDDSMIFLSGERFIDESRKSLSSYIGVLPTDTEKKVKGKYFECSRTSEIYHCPHQMDTPCYYDPNVACEAFMACTNKHPTFPTLYEITEVKLRADGEIIFDGICYYSYLHYKSLSEFKSEPLSEHLEDLKATEIEFRLMKDKKFETLSQAT